MLAIAEHADRLNFCLSGPIVAYLELSRSSKMIKEDANAPQELIVLQLFHDQINCSLLRIAPQRTKVVIGSLHLYCKMFGAQISVIDNHEVMGKLWQLLSDRTILRMTRFKNVCEVIVFTSIGYGG